MIHLDTHVVAWILRGDSFPAAVRRRLDQPWGIAPMVRLELALLHEIGRFPGRPDEIIGALREVADVTEVEASHREVIRAAVPLSWTRDPFDRLIAATAIAADAPLLTRDRRMRANMDRAVWDEPDAA